MENSRRKLIIGLFSTILVSGCIGFYEDEEGPEEVAENFVHALSEGNHSEVEKYEDTSANVETLIVLGEEWKGYEIKDVKTVESHSSTAVVEVEGESSTGDTLTSEIKLRKQDDAWRVVVYK